MPPRVPMGVPGAWAICDWPCSILKVAEVALAWRSPMARRLIWLAARRYPCISCGEKLWTSATLSKPALIVSAGR